VVWQQTIRVRVSSEFYPRSGNGKHTPVSPIATMCYKCYDGAMSRMITQRELRNQSAAVLREIEAGRTVVVTRNGTPVAEMRPLRPRRFVPRAIIADAAARAPRVDAARFRADLDAVIDQRVDG
jgi:prevent-host-death family protein